MGDTCMCAVARYPSGTDSNFFARHPARLRSYHLPHHRPRPSVTPLDFAPDHLPHHRPRPSV
ncbi:MAG: hypothetical protein M3256_11725, partial [Actinomycetota bacterium]|nr:hypothetical protein [Actinomycetota bacterium]